MSTDSSNDKAAEARAGLLGSIAGKAKEVAGAMTGKDDLVEEGQFQQAEARTRKTALADDALADAKLGKAAQELHETSRETAEQTRAAGAQAEREKSEVEQQRASEHAAADQSADCVRPNPSQPRRPQSSTKQPQRSFASSAKPPPQTTRPRSCAPRPRAWEHHDPHPHRDAL